MTRVQVRRLVALMVLAAIAGAAVALLTGGGGSRPAGHGKKSFLDALAPVLARPGGGATATAPGQPATRVPEIAAQLFMVGFPGKDATAPFFAGLRRRAWGAVVLDASNYASQDQLAALTRHIGFVARSAHDPAPVVAAIQLGGEDSSFPDLPPAEPEIATADAKDAATQAVQAGTDLRRLGVTMTLGPSADLATPGGAWADRGYDADPGTTSDDVAAAVAGYSAAHVLSVPGHFPGEGAASRDPATGPATVGLSLAQLRAADLQPFEAVLRTAPAIQLSSAAYAAWDGVTPATLLPQAVRLLRSLGFRGAIVSGDLQAATLATGGSPAQAAVAALKAGCDLLYLPGDASDQQAAWAAVAAAIRSGRVPAQRVADALAHVQALQNAWGPASGHPRGGLRHP
ncbi:MAG TPA: glycoside hydrolase family 3 N-terminal domain-containing protein [Solirubrobacteraceae bacterium]|nr:glycoside hydrolase family 3 N-terminal domain-containing protein [Solirubrobacteraceae bacterium]